jgi:hypothetical protein
LPTGGFSPPWASVGDVGAELVVATLVFGDLHAVHVDLGPPVDGAEVEPQPFAGADLPVGRDGEGAAVPHPVLVPFDPGELGLHRVRDQDLLGEVPAHRRLLARLGGGELPGAVEVAPGVAGELRPGVLGQGVARPHVVGPLGPQFVRGVVGAAAPERFDNVAVGSEQATLAVVAQVRGAAGGTGLVADDRFLQRDVQGLGVGRVQPGFPERPLGAADDGLHVVGETGGGCLQLLREVEAERAAVLEDRGADGAVVVVALGQAQRRLRHGLLGAAWLGPAQVEVGAAEVLEVLDLDVVGASGGEFHGGRGLLAVPVVDPVVDDRFPVDPQPEAVVTGDREGVGAGLLRHDPAGPADVDVVRLPGGEVQARLQVVEVEVGVEAGGLELVEVEGSGGGLGVVLALEPVDLDGVVGGGRGGCGGESRHPERCREQEGHSDSESSDAHGSSLLRKGGGSVLQSVQRWKERQLA